MKKLNLVKDSSPSTRLIFDSEHVIIIGYDDYMGCVLAQPIDPNFRPWVEQNLAMLPTLLCEQFFDHTQHADEYELDIKILAGLKPKTAG